MSCQVLTAQLGISPLVFLFQNYVQFNHFLQVYKVLNALVLRLALYIVAYSRSN